MPTRLGEQHLKFLLSYIVVEGFLMVIVQNSIFLAEILNAHSTQAIKLRSYFRIRILSRFHACLPRMLKKLLSESVQRCVRCRRNGAQLVEASSRGHKPVLEACWALSLRSVLLAYHKELFLDWACLSCTLLQL